MSHPLLIEWKEKSSLLRICAGSKGLGFDSLCRIKSLDDERLVLEWESGDSCVTLSDVTFETYTLSEQPPDDRRLSEEAEWTQQLIIRWPSTPERLCILFEQRDPS